jgi:DNA-binding transcriptional MerR regulator
MEGAVQKSPDAFRTISEVADDLDVPKHVLRFWEGKFAQLRPMKRGGGRRYYRPEDVELLRGIRRLLYEDGYTIKGVQKILREQGVRYVMDVWQAGDDEDSELRREIPDVAAEARSAVVVRPNRDQLGSARARDLAALLAELETCQELLAEAKG